MRFASSRGRSSHESAMKIAVTGASGFVGGRIARALAAAGHDVTSYGRRPARMLTTSLPGYQPGDLSGRDAPRIVADAVVHRRDPVARDRR